MTREDLITLAVRNAYYAGQCGLDAEETIRRVTEHILTIPSIPSESHQEKLWWGVDLGAMMGLMG